MSLLAKLFGLTVEAVFLQLFHGVGFVAALIALVAGYFRVPSWCVPVLAVAFGFGADRLTDVAGLSGKASSATDRAAFMIFVYLAIAAVGYLAGRYIRSGLAKRKSPPTPE
ncbi:MAG: hypothetical protein HYS06_12500 [Methylocystis sp.]|nr:hypothetical protein [Methylocystis sp.]